MMVWSNAFIREKSDVQVVFRLEMTGCVPSFAHGVITVATASIQVSILLARALVASEKPA